jgi:hypothetical protein
VVTTEEFGEVHTGDGAFYTFADGSGACLYDKTADFHSASRNISDWANRAGDRAGAVPTSAHQRVGFSGLSTPRVASGRESDLLSTACTTLRSTNERRNEGSRMCSSSERA